MDFAINDLEESSPKKRSGTQLADIMGLPVGGGDLLNVAGVIQGSE